MSCEGVFDKPNHVGIMQMRGPDTDVVYSYIEPRGSDTDDYSDESSSGQTPRYTTKKTLSSRVGKNDVSSNTPKLIRVPSSPEEIKIKPVDFAITARVKSLLAIAWLYFWSPFLICWAFSSWIWHRMFGPSFVAPKAEKKLRILVTGGKMSKSSAVSRALGRCGHDIFTAEISPYEFCHTRFGAYVKGHYVLPRPAQEPEKWREVILGIVKKHDIDLIVPCTAPIESSAYAHLRQDLPPNVRVFAFDAETSDKLDNKYTFNQVLVKAGLKCPETINMECVEDAVDFFDGKELEVDDGKKYIVKPAVYDPKARTEILFLPIADKAKQYDYLKSRNASRTTPYVIQELLENPEYGTYAIFNKGRLTGFEFFPSSASCLVYRSERGKKYEDALKMHQDIGKAMNLTGQFTLDLMHTADGDIVPIECNPRIHSACCTLEGKLNFGRAFYDADFMPEHGNDVVTSTTGVFKYWVMDQLFLMAGFWKPKNCFKLSVWEMLSGTDALLHGDDPLPFLAMYLIQIPSLLFLEFLTGTEWLKIDFCIGKIVKEGGD